MLKEALAAADTVTAQLTDTSRVEALAANAAAIMAVVAFEMLLA